MITVAIWNKHLGRMDELIYLKYNIFSFYKQAGLLLLQAVTSWFSCHFHHMEIVRTYQDMKVVRCNKLILYRVIGHKKYLFHAFK